MQIQMEGNLDFLLSLKQQQVDFLIRNERAMGLLDLDVLMNRTHTVCSAALEYLISFESTYKLFKKDLELSQKKIFVDQEALMNFGKGKDSFDKITHNPIPDLVVGLADKTNCIDILRCSALCEWT